MLYPSIVSQLELLIIVYIITQFDKIITEGDTQHISISISFIIHT